MTLNRYTPIQRSPMPPGDPAKALSRRARIAPSGASSATLRARGHDSRATGRGGMGQPKAGPKGEFSDATKLLVRRRAGNGCAEDAMCEACGKGLGRYGGQVHHVVNRGMGGSRNEVINSAANAALLCGTPADKDTCHGKATALDAELGARGFWLDSGTDPRTVPMMLASEHGSGISVWRSVDGSYLFQAPGSVAA